MKLQIFYSSQTSAELHMPIGEKNYKKSLSKDSCTHQVQLKQCGGNLAMGRQIISPAKKKERQKRVSFFCYLIPNLLQQSFEWFQIQGIMFNFLNALCCSIQLASAKWLADRQTPCYTELGKSLQVRICLHLYVIHFIVVLF